MVLLHLYKKKFRNWIWRNRTPEVLINLPKDAQLISGNKSTSFLVFVNIWQNILQFIFAKVIDKIIALCYLTIIYLISDNSLFPVLFSYWICYLSHRSVVRNKVNICEGLASVKCDHRCPMDGDFYCYSWLSYWEI